MDRKLVAVFVVIAVTLLLYNFNSVYLVLTGNVPAVSLGIASVADAEMRLTHLSTIYIGDIINITAEMQNTGSVSYNEIIEIRIKDVNLTDLEVTKDGTNTLDPGEYRAFDIIYFPNTTGFYWIRAQGDYLDQDVVDWGLFYVFPPDPIYVYIGGSPSSSSKTSTKRTGPVIRDLQVDYQENVVLLRGQSFIHPITITNVGNIDIENIEILLDYKIPVVNLIPLSVERLGKTESALFFLETTIPIEYPLGVHEIEFKVNSSLIQTEEIIKLDVREFDLREGAYQMLLNYMYLARLVERESLLLSINGQNTSYIDELLAEADQGIEESLNLFNKDQYQEVIDKLGGEVKPLLEKALEEIAKLKVIHVFRLPGYLPYVILILILVLMPLTFILIRRFKYRESVKA